MKKKLIIILIFITFLLILIFFAKFGWKISNVDENIKGEQVNPTPTPITILTPTIINEANRVGVKTEVIKYKQTYVPKESKSGECWTISSAATSNDKAWRCFVGDFIYDPCFETESNKLVCDVDPEINDSGFELKLTKALPERTSYSKEEASKWSWKVKLQNGLACEVMTGTGGIIDINEELYYYTCDQKNVVLLGYLDKSSQPWKAKVAYLSDSHRQIIKSEVIDIIKAWE